MIKHLFPPTESCLYTEAGSSQSQGTWEYDCTASSPLLPKEVQREAEAALGPPGGSVPVLIQPDLSTYSI